MKYRTLAIEPDLFAVQRRVLFWWVTLGTGQSLGWARDMAERLNAGERI